METAKLIANLRKANLRWDRAMRREGYPDPDDPYEKEFTPEEWDLYEMADAWRKLVHKLENRIEKQPDYRNWVHQQTALKVSTDPTIYQTEQRPENLPSAQDVKVRQSKKKGHNAKANLASGGPGKK